MKTHQLRTWTALLVLAFLAACGGGGGGGGGGSSLQISGTAATGAAIVNGTVEVKCQSGTGSTTTSTTGTYIVDVTSGVQPCILRVTDPISKLVLHSVVETGATTANITPATDLVVANALGENPTSAFTNYANSQQQKITATNISAAVTRIQTATAALGSSADMSDIDIMKGTLQAATNEASGNSADQKIDALMAALAAADKKISDLSSLLTNSTSGISAASQLTTLVGNAQYSLASCPAARSGDIWVLDLLGTAPAGFNANFNSMVLKNLSNNSTSAIDFKRDAQSAIIPCAFSASVNGATVEFRVTDGGIGVWKNANDFGITVPAQRSKSLTDAAFAGIYPAAGFLRNTSNNARAALPFKFQIDSSGNLQGYSCDLTKSIPECITPLDNTNSSETSCVAQSNGTLSCSDANGLRATAVLFVTGGQATMFMSVTALPIGGADLKGLIVMTKAANMVLPTAGQTSPAGSSWYAGVNPGGSTVVSGDTSASKVDSVNTAANSFVTSSTGSSVTYTRYINTPSSGLGYASGSDGSRAIAIGSATGWSMAMVKSNSGTAYDGWFTYARAKR